MWWLVGWWEINQTDVIFNILGGFNSRFQSNNSSRFGNRQIDILAGRWVGRINDR